MELNHFQKNQEKKGPTEERNLPAQLIDILMVTKKEILIRLKSLIQSICYPEDIVDYYVLERVLHPKADRTVFVVTQFRNFATLLNTLQAEGYSIAFDSGLKLVSDDGKHETFPSTSENLLKYGKIALPLTYQFMSQLFYRFLPANKQKEEL